MATMLRQTQLVVEVLVKNAAKLRSYQEVVEAAVGDDSATPLRFYQVVVEALIEEGSGTSYENSLTIAGTANITLTPGTGWPQTLSIDGTSALTDLDGFVYQLSQTIAGTAALTGVDTAGKNESITISATADIDVDFLYLQQLALTIAATANVALAANNGKFSSLTIAATANFFSPGGVVYFIQRSIEGTANIAGLEGFVYEKSLQVDGTAALATTFIYVMNHTLTIAGTADITTTHTYFANPTLTIAGTAALARTPDGVWFESLSIPGTARIFIENIYDVLFVTAVTAGFTADVFKEAPGDQNPSSISSFSAVGQCVFNRPVSQTLALTHAVIVKKPQQQAQHTIAFSHTAVCKKIAMKLVTQSITFTQTAIAVRAINQSIVFAHSAICQRIKSRSVTQTLNLTHTAARNNVISRSLTHSLVFNPPNLERLPIIGSQNQTGNRQFEYYVPTVYAVLVPKKCLVILGVPSQTIILPCPIWGDSQAYQGEINLKRAMTGITYTYVKKTKTQKLNYSFELGTYKWLELRDFYINHSEEVMLLQNHNAETWLVHMVNNPLESTTEGRWQPKGEKYNVTLEFEGVKIGG